MLAIAYSESNLNYDVKHPDINTVGIGGIKKLWLKELNQNKIPINSLRAIEYVYEKIGLKAYKGTLNSFKSYNRTIKLYRRIK